MARWLTSLFFLIVLGSSALLSGTPLSKNGSEKEMCEMKCCKSSSVKAVPKQVTAAKLCCAVNCAASAPTSTTSAQMNLAPLLVVLKNFPIFQFLLVPQQAEKAQPLFAETAQLKTFQPKYIQNNSFLI